eukprot:gnl/TRDRNA2_/TRDRNA2_30502_c0_seq1.p1 gnl/TRDRNA2_/TRDRNA2_30502_c0~~gnl/TRDRNA2_/TRDRNA2_30502_c0_seq1.p1  ORF type:complete len:510 (+),score=86.27 gnl/TRDRNA2_/TRDRNA2_30502_c0_seq1:51-1580(+)
MRCANVLFFFALRVQAHVKQEPLPDHVSTAAVPANRVVASILNSLDDIFDAVDSTMLAKPGRLVISARWNQQYCKEMLFTRSFAHAAELLKGAPVALGSCVADGRRWRSSHLQAQAGKTADDAMQQVGELTEYGCISETCEVDYGPDSNNIGPTLLEDPSGEFMSTEAADVQRFAARPSGFSIPVLEVFTDGSIRTANVTRGEVLENTGLRPRDLRVVVTSPLPGSDTAQVVIRRPGAVVLGVGEIRAVIQPNRALLFSVDARTTPRFLRVLAKRRQEYATESLLLAFTESALQTLSRRLEARNVQIRTVSEPFLQQPPRAGVSMSSSIKVLEMLRQQRRRLLRYASEAEATSQAVQRCLDSDEREFSAASYNKQAVPDWQIEWDEMLETNFRLFGDLAREFRRLLDEIEDFEGTAALALQERRLLVEEFELSLIILSISIGTGALITGIFGMNLMNRYESSEFGFPLVVFITLGIGVSAFSVLRMRAAKEGLLPEGDGETDANFPLFI